MKNRIVNSKSILLLFLLAFVTSCHSQFKTDSPEKENVNAQLGDYIIEIVEDSKGNLWFGTLTKGVAKYDGNSLRYYTTDDGLNDNRVGSIVEDANGHLWFGGHHGLSKYDGESFLHYTEDNGLCDNRVSNLLIDSEGILWIGTWGGVCKFDGTKFSNFSIPIPDIELLSYQSTMNWLTEIHEDSKGNIWFGRDGYGACKYDGETFTHFNKRDGLASNTLRDIQEDANGNIWFSSRMTENDHPDPDQRQGPGGLIKYDGENFVDFPDLKGLYNNDVYQIYRDTKDNLWIGTLRNGIYKYDGKEFTNYTFVSGTPKAVTNILEDSKGRIWIGCAGGLFRLDSDRVVNVTRSGPWE